MNNLLLSLLSTSSCKNQHCFRGSVYIEGYNETAIRSVLAVLEEHNSSWSVAVCIYFANNSRNIVKGSLEIEFLGNITKERDILITPNVDGEYVHRKILNVSKVNV